MHTASTAPGLAPRLHFLDALRLIAFGLLVPYHVGMYYVSWDWHLKSPQASPTLEPLMLLSAPWRLSLLFWVAGAAWQMVLARSCSGRLLARRMRALLLPLAFGMLVVVPPQSWLEVGQKLGDASGYLAFWARYLQGDGSFCRDGDCLQLPTWNHLWFLPYLTLYSAVAWGLARWARSSAWSRLALAPLARLAAAWPLGPGGLLLGLALPFMLARLLLVSRFPSTHDLLHDVYNHVQYGMAFGLGALMAWRGAPAWQAVQAQRWPALGLALLGWAALAWYFHTWRDQAPPELLRSAQRLLWGGVQAWAVVAATGWARHLLNQDRPGLREAGAAVLCLYVLHQTLILLLAQALAPWGLPALPEGLLILAGTCAGCAVAYVVVRRVPWLAPALGVPPSARRGWAAVR